MVTRTLGTGSKNGGSAGSDRESGPMGHDRRFVLPCDRYDLRIGIDWRLLDSRHLCFIGRGTGGRCRMPRIRTYAVRRAPLASDPPDIDRHRAIAVAWPNR